jgi:hypothetical protein
MQVQFTASNTAGETALDIPVGQRQAWPSEGRAPGVSALRVALVEWRRLHNIRPNGSGSGALGLVDAVRYDARLLDCRPQVDRRGHGKTVPGNRGALVLPLPSRRRPPLNGPRRSSCASLERRDGKPLPRPVARRSRVAAASNSLARSRSGASTNPGARRRTLGARFRPTGCRSRWDPPTRTSSTSRAARGFGPLDRSPIHCTR